MSGKSSDQDELGETFEDFLNRQDSTMNLLLSVKSSGREVDKVGSLVDDDENVSFLSSASNILPNVSINADDDTEDEKEKFFEKIEAEATQKSKIVDYSLLNRQLDQRQQQNSIDHGYIQDFDETAAVAATNETKTDDDLESIQSSLHDIENSLNMSDSELLAQIDSEPETTKNSALKNPKTIKSLSRGSFRPSSARLSSVSSSGSFRKSMVSSSSSPALSSLKRAAPDVPDNSQLKQLKKEMDFMQSIMDKEREEANKCKLDLRERETELEKLRTEHHIFSEENRDLKIQLEKLIIKLQASSTDEKDLIMPSQDLLAEQEALIRGYEMENEKLVKQIKEAETTLKEYRLNYDDEKERYLNEISLLNTRLIEKEGSDPVRQRVEDEKRRQIEKIKAEFMQSEKNLIEKIAKLEHDLNIKVETERTEYTKIIEDQKKQLAELEKTMKQQLREKELKIQELKSQLLNKSKLANQQQSQLKTSKISAKPATGPMRSLNADLKKIKELEAELFDKQSICREFEAQISGLQKMMSEKSVALEKEKLWVQEEASTKLRELREQHVQILHTLQDKSQQLESRTAELLDLKAKMKDEPGASGRIIHLETSLKQAEKDLEQTKEKLSKLENVEDAFKSIKSIVETLRSELESKKSECNALKTELQNLKDSYQKIYTELTKKEAIVEHNTKQLQDLSSKTAINVGTKEAAENGIRQEMDLLQRKSNSLEAENSALKQKLNLSETLRQTLTDQYKKLYEDSLKEVPVKSNSAQNLKVALSDKEDEVIRLKDRISANDKQLKSYQIRISGLEEELESTKLRLLNITRNQEEDGELRQKLEKVETEKQKLSSQLELLKLKGSPDVTMWHDLLNQISEIEVKLKQDEKKWLDDQENRKMNVLLNRMDTMRESYEDRLRKREEQMESLRRELDVFISTCCAK